MCLCAGYKCDSGTATSLVENNPCDAGYYCELGQDSLTKALCPNGTTSLSGRYLRAQCTQIVSLDEETEALISGMISTDVLVKKSFYVNGTAPSHVMCRDPWVQTQWGDFCCGEQCSDYREFIAPIDQHFRDAYCFNTTNIATRNWENCGSFMNVTIPVRASMIGTYPYTGTGVNAKKRIWPGCHDAAGQLFAP
jgi:hypothetical protein